VISCRQVRARGTLVHHVEQQHALLTVVLELFQILARLRGGALDLEESNFVGSKRFCDLFHEVGELDEDEDAFVGRDALPVAMVSGQPLHSHLCGKRRYVPDQVYDLLQLHPKMLPLAITLVIVNSKRVAFDDIENSGGRLASARTSVHARLALGSSFDVIVTSSMAARREDGDFFERNALAAALGT